MMNYVNTRRFQEYFDPWKLFSPPTPLLPFSEFEKIPIITPPQTG